MDKKGDEKKATYLIIILIILIILIFILYKMLQDKIVKGVFGGL